MITDIKQKITAHFATLVGIEFRAEGEIITNDITTARATLRMFDLRLTEVSHNYYVVSVGVDVLIQKIIDDDLYSPQELADVVYNKFSTIATDYGCLTHSGVTVEDYGEQHHLYQMALRATYTMEFAL